MPRKVPHAFRGSSSYASGHSMGNYPVETESLLTLTTKCELCNHLALQFELMLEYHATARANYEKALESGRVVEAAVFESELASSSDPIRRAAKDLRDHEGVHLQQATKVRDRLLRLVKSSNPKHGRSFLLNEPETA